MGGGAGVDRGDVLPGQQPSIGHRPQLAAGDVQRVQHPVGLLLAGEMDVVDESVLPGADASARAQSTDAAADLARVGHFSPLDVVDRVVCELGFDGLEGARLDVEPADPGPVQLGAVGQAVLGSGTRGQLVVDEHLHHASTPSGVGAHAVGMPGGV